VDDARGRGALVPTVGPERWQRDGDQDGDQDGDEAVMRMSAGFGADAMSLEETAQRLAQAASVVRDLRDHAGVVRGRAADAGDEELAAAIVAFAQSWQWGLEVVGAEADRWAVAVRAVARTYRELETDVLGRSVR
jgi:hypothetical protein